METTPRRGLTTSPEDPKYNLNKTLKDKDVWSIQIFEKNIERTRDEIRYNNKKVYDYFKIDGTDVKITPKRYNLASRFDLTNSRGITGGHETKHFLTKNRGAERKANRSHKRIQQQKIRKHNGGSKPHTRYKNPRFL